MTRFSRLQVVMLFLILGGTSCTPQTGSDAKPSDPSDRHADSLFALQSGRRLGVQRSSLSDDLSTSVACVGNVLTTPLRWSGKDALVAGSVVLGTAGAFLLDDEARDLSLRNHSAFAEDVLVEVGHTFSTVLYMGPSALALYFSGVALENQWMRETGQMLTEAVITAGIVQMPVSITVGRARPFFNEGNTSFRAFAGSNDDRASFFSGHSMIAFSFATILSKQIDNTWATIGLYTLATLGPYARLYKDRHWLSDTVLGSALGVFVGNSVWNWHKSESHSSADVRIIPSLNGVSLVWVLP